MPEPILHYVYEDPEGPIVSGADDIGGDAGREMLDKLAPGQLAAPGRKKRLRIACNPKAVPTEWHRVTGSAHRVAGGHFIVTCPGCLSSERFKADAAALDTANEPGPMQDSKGNCC